jgi:hypothetical protein
VDKGETIINTKTCRVVRVSSRRRLAACSLGRAQPTGLRRAVARGRVRLSGDFSNLIGLIGLENSSRGFNMLAACFNLTFETDVGARPRESGRWN